MSESKLIRRLRFLNEFIRNRDFLSLKNAILLSIGFLPRGANRYLHNQFGNFYVRGGTTDFLYTAESWEKLTYNYLKNIKCDCLILIGACIGEWAVKLKNNYDHFILIDPNHESLDIAKINCCINNIRADFLSTACSDDSKNVFLKTMNYNVGSSYISESVESGGILVQSTTLDSLLAEHNLDRFNSFVVMIDAEGTEEKIIRGGFNFLNSQKDITLICEYSHPNTSLNNLVESLDEYSHNIIDKDNVVFRKKQSLPIL